MRILIANDDGYLAPGLAALVKACEGLGELDVVAPEQNASGTSNSLTLGRPLSVHTASNGFLYINGTPSDCVHLALTGVLPQRPDLVVSGINNGANMGDDTLYSGTVAAAMEGYLFGIPAIAFSQVAKGWADLDAAARWTGAPTRRPGARPVPPHRGVSSLFPPARTRSRGCRTGSPPSPRRLCRSTACRRPCWPPD